MTSKVRSLESRVRVSGSAAVFFILIALFASGCEVTPGENYVPVLNVHGLLFASDTFPDIWVNRTYRIDEGESLELGGVGVRIWRGRDTWGCYTGWGSLSSQYYSDTRIRISPRDTFGLEVSKPGFDTVRGRTIIPDTFSIIEPRTGDTIGLADSLIFTRRRCRGYFLSGRYFFGSDTFYFYEALPNESLPALGYDSQTVRLPAAFLAGEREGPLTLRVLALDSSYFDWVDQGVANQNDRFTNLASGITGGVGVFGSAAACSVRVYFSRDTTRFR